MSNNRIRPRLTLGHATLPARDMDRLTGFYCDVLGFEITNRGPIGDGENELAFLCQDPTSHHQIAMISGVAIPDSDFVLFDHFAFRTGTLDDLRALRANLQEAGVEGIIPVCHGNAWSLYFADCEGNGLECYVDTPFHVAQPFAEPFDLDQSDEEILEATRLLLADKPEFRSMGDWKAYFAKRLAERDR